MPFDDSHLGLPVALNQISHQLKALWDSDSERTRASRLNFVVYCQGTENLTANTELISKFVRTHACRAILIGDCPSAPVPKVSAWIQAHCHISKAGAKQICSEQITLLAEGLSEEGVANALMANLDYDLPLNIWWQAPFPPLPSSPLWSRVDRLIFDSQLWQDPSDELQRLDLIKAKGNTHLTVADLNWTRTMALRQALAQCFDLPQLINELALINHLEIRHAADSRLTALLVLSWFAAQLGWMSDHVSDEEFSFRNRANATVIVNLLTSSNDSVSGVTLRSPNSTVMVERARGASLFEATIKTSAGTSEAHFSGGNQETTALLSEELTPGLKHRVYQKAAAILEVLVP
ncbi:MAG: glucose-6-phosphate dehydrogenase assembly protein OpcA [Verrucomicrobiota bacterium]